MVTSPMFSPASNAAVSKKVKNKNATDNANNTFVTISAIGPSTTFVIEPIFQSAPSSAPAVVALPFPTQTQGPIFGSHSRDMIVTVGNSGVPTAPIAPMRSAVLKASPTTKSSHHGFSSGSASHQSGSSV